jgi:hypothetical protein
MDVSLFYLNARTTRSGKPNAPNGTPPLLGPSRNNVVRNSAYAAVASVTSAATSSSVRSSPSAPTRSRKPA